MNLSKIRLTNALAVVDLPIVGALPTDAYILKQVDGLGPPDINLFTEDTLYQGGVHRGRRPEGREIVARIKLNPNYQINQSPGDLRSYLYGLLSSGDLNNSDILTVQLYDAAGAIWANTKGYVRRVVPVPFSQDPEVQITIACLNSYLSAPAEVTQGSHPSKSIFYVQNTAGAPSGFYMEVVFTVARTTWSLYKGGPNTLPKMQFDHDFAIGDKLSFDTRAGQRSIKRTRGAAVTSILGSLTSDSIWLQLHGGQNTFWTSNQNIDPGFFARFAPQYWGI